MITADGPVYLICELGCNHLGNLDDALRLIDVAVEAGADAVKFQKRNPKEAVPEDQWHLPKETPFGTLPYIEYRHRMEFGLEQYRQIDEHCKRRGLDWFASAWDIDSVNFLEQFDLPYQKVPSACLTDHELLRHMASKGRPVILSTGMSTPVEIDDAVRALLYAPTYIAHCTSTYPCPSNEINLRSMDKLWEREVAKGVVGYSGHEEGIIPTLGAVALGARFVERHITLDRTMWGSDQKASLDPPMLKELVSGIREMEQALGDGIKRVYDSELPQMEKLRKVGRKVPA